MICAPDPRVIDNRVVAIDEQIHNGATDGSSSIAKENVVQQDRILPVACMTLRGPHLQQNWRFFFAGVEKQAGKVDSAHIRGDDGCGPVDRTKSREAEAHHHGVCS